jgi:hypothetical protein
MWLWFRMRWRLRRAGRRLWSSSFWLEETYPPGSSFRLTVGAGETLDVYQGKFRVGMRVVAPKGASTLTGSLRYQACDNAACFPARTLAVKVALTGR